MSKFTSKYKTIVIKKCKHCKKKFIAIPADIKRGKGKFCSRSCSSSWNRINKVIGIHKGGKRSKKWSLEMSEKLKGKYIKDKNKRWKGERYINHAGYCRVSNPNGPGRVFEHRLIAEQCLKRNLLKTEIIHHINGIKTDNNSENLYLFSNRKLHDQHEGYKSKPLLISNII